MLERTHNRFFFLQMPNVPSLREYRNQSTKVTNQQDGVCSPPTETNRVNRTENNRHCQQQVKVRIKNAKESYSMIEYCSHR